MTNNELKKQINFLNGKVSEIRDIMKETRNIMCETVYELCKKYGDKDCISFEGDEDMLYDLCVEYDGGGHPEYASNAYSQVYSVQAREYKDRITGGTRKSFSLYTEDSVDYSEGRLVYEDVWGVFEALQSILFDELKLGE